MKTQSILGLGLALAVPALIQPAQAQEKSIAEQALEAMIAIAEGYFEIIGAVNSGEASPEAAAAGIKQLVTAAEQVQAGIEAMGEEDQAILAQIMQDEEVIAAFGNIEKALKELDDALKTKNYFDSEELKAACDAFNAM